MTEFNETSSITNSQYCFERLLGLYSYRIEYLGNPCLDKDFVYTKACENIALESCSVWSLCWFGFSAVIPALRAFQDSFTSVYLISFIIQTALAHVSFFGVIASSVDKLLDVNLYLELKKICIQHILYVFCLLCLLFAEILLSCFQGDL